MSIHWGNKPDQQQIERARDLIEKGWDWSAAAKAVGSSRYMIRCAIDPSYREHRQNLVRDYREKYGASRFRPPRYPTVFDDGSRIGMTAIGENAASISIPRQVEAERQRYLAYHHTEITAALQGDPPPWRSALGRKNGWL